MPVATVQELYGPTQRHGAMTDRARGLPACNAQPVASCDGCRARALSPCAAMEDAEGAVVPPFRVAEQKFSAGQTIVEQGEVGHEYCVIICGWAVQYELLEDGGRQILDFLLPGSTVGFHPEGGERSPHSVQALTQVHACRFSRAGFLDAAKSNPALALRLAAVASRNHYRSLRRLTLIGRRTAKERVAALLLDLHCRSRMGPVPPRDDEIPLPLPLTQEHIGDALGLTNVHVNRMLRELREEGVLVLKRGMLRLLDLPRLVEIAGSDDGPSLRQPSLAARCV